METRLMRSWISHIQEAYEGERTLDQTITRNLTQYGQEASRMELAGGDPQPDYPKLKTAADLMRVLDQYIDELGKSDALEDGAAPVLLARLKALNLERNAQQLDQIAKIPAPEPNKTQP